ncbi:MAG: hypothetical protein EZS28_011756 [Streblomastix strix]|uniref:Uncharacterized protein n=1 Tax=Streblomastix strix TaxID=222440 RepID=A0A5J4WCQ7_9EUKA|nr:MAG: hypothetical protein EZS28_011756 [Streblomastix strix]
MDKVAFQIRNKCIQLFERIYEEGNQNALESLTKNGHANSLVIKVGADDGYYGIDGEELDSNLFDLRCFFRTLHKGRQFYPQYQVYPSYPPQICLAQQSEEQLEEEGSLEDIDAYLINQLNNEKIKKSVNLAKNSIFNIFHDDTNTYDGKDEDLYEDALEEGEESSEEFGDDGDE